MTCAVVLSAYNGENYIEEQLLSLLRQTRQPDAVIIRDDGSSDRTPALIERFIRDRGLKSWSFSVNEKNRGWMKNFRELILGAEADVVFPCDQDDIWHETKLEEMCAILEQNPQIDLLACGYTPRYEDSTRRVSRRILKTMNDSGRIEEPAMDERFLNVLRPGCTFAVRRDFCLALAPAWDEGLPHDAMLWRCALVKGTARLYQKPLITWRRYNTSSSNPNSAAREYADHDRLMLDFYVGNCESHLLFLRCARKLIESGRLVPRAGAERLLRRSEEYETAQREALLSHSVLRNLGCALRYRRFYLSKKSPLAYAYISMRTKN